MIHKTQGIVLSHLKYGETSLVVTMYTRDFGRKTFLVQGVFGKKSKFRPTFFQPFSLLNIEAYIQPRRDLQRLKEIGFAVSLHGLPFDTIKSTIALFLSEILYKTLREEEPNPPLFDFLFHAIQVLDLKEAGVANFHLAFLVQLSKHLGFYPLDNFSTALPLFDTANGRFHPSGISSADPLARETSKYLHVFLNTSFDAIESVTMPHQLRISLLNLLVDFYSHHLGGLGNVKSLPVLQSVFE